jgi:hypothetical protein
MFCDLGFENFCSKKHEEVFVPAVGEREMDSSDVISINHDIPAFNESEDITHRDDIDENPNQDLDRPEENVGQYVDPSSALDPAADNQSEDEDVEHSNNIGSDNESEDITHRDDIDENPNQDLDRPEENVGQYVDPSPTLDPAEEFRVLNYEVSEAIRQFRQIQSCDPFNGYKAISKAFWKLQKAYQVAKDAAYRDDYKDLPSLKAKMASFKTMMEEATYPESKGPARKEWWIKQENPIATVGAAEDLYSYSDQEW